MLIVFTVIVWRERSSTGGPSSARQLNLLRLWIDKLKEKGERENNMKMSAVITVVSKVSNVDFLFVIRTAL